MKQIQRYNACDEIDYDRFDGDDVIGLIRRELAYFPDSCFSKLCIEWYNATYVALGKSIEVGCTTESDLTDDEELTLAVIQLLLSKGRRGGRRFLNQLFRRARKALVQGTSRDI